MTILKFVPCISKNDKIKNFCIKYTFSLQIIESADLAIEIPGNLGQEGSSYRLDYHPARGRPPPNSTFVSKDIGDVIQFSQGLPGTKYEFWLYYSNATVSDKLTWSASITTGTFPFKFPRYSFVHSNLILFLSAPDPPSNLTIITRGGKQASVSWSPPLQGHHSGYKLRLISLSEPSAPLRNLPVEDDTSKYVIRDLHPGATYQLQAYTVFEGKESVAYTSTNFTTSTYQFHLLDNRSSRITFFSNLSARRKRYFKVGKVFTNNCIEKLFIIY